MPDVSIDAPSSDRISRRKQRTRGRLVGAALTVMAQKGVDATTISDITETADVGFGSFYNYFTSKDEILDAAVAELFETIGTRIDASVATIEDPCRAIATAIRILVGMLIARKDWAEFIVRICAVPGYKQLSLYARLFRDIEKVRASGRLPIADPEIVTYAVGGAILFMVVALVEGDLPAAGAPERIAAMALRMLGATEAAIGDLVDHPLPDLAPAL
jgi:AcrR family transcriptional regulator